MLHHTKDKGDIAVAKVIADLTLKGFSVFIPLSEHLPFDLIGYSNNRSLRFQIKYSKNGCVNKVRSWSDKRGVHRSFYGADDFDYFAVYVPQIDKIVYPSIRFGGATIRFSIPRSATPFYWYEDFLTLTDTATKRTYREFNIDLSTAQDNRKERPEARKCIWPNKTLLNKLLWEMPTTHIAKQYGVSDNAVAKWARKYELDKPPRGHWQKQRKAM